MAGVTLIDSRDRDQLLPLINSQSASDAIAAYYALQNPAGKTKIYVNFDGGGKPNSFLVIAQTGIDLFRPLAVPFVASPSTLRDLLLAALRPGQPVILYLPLDQRDWLDVDYVLSDLRVTELLRMEATHFKPIVNVLVSEVITPDGLPRYEVRAASGAYATAGINWMGNKFSEVYLESDHEARIKSLAISVLAAISNRVLDRRRIPLFRLDDSSAISRDELQNLGYRSTGSRTLIAQVLRKPDRLVNDA